MPVDAYSDRTWFVLYGFVYATELDYDNELLMSPFTTFPTKSLKNLPLLSAPEISIIQQLPCMCEVNQCNKPGMGPILPHKTWTMILLSGLSKGMSVSWKKIYCLGS